MKNIPFVSISSEELYSGEDLTVKDKIACPRCKTPHSIEISSGLAFYRCSGKTYLCGIDGKAVFGATKA